MFYALFCPLLDVGFAELYNIFLTRHDILFNIIIVEMDSLEYTYGLALIFHLSKIISV